MLSSFQKGPTFEVVVVHYIYVLYIYNYIYSYIYSSYIQFSLLEITLHEDVMYDPYMKESVKEFEQLYKKMHCKLTEITFFSKNSKLSI